MKASNNINQAIQAYLEDRAKTDNLFAVSFAKPNKSIEECYAYIWGEVYKRSVSIPVPRFNGKGAGVYREEIFGMAVHYYDEDNIKVSKMPANVKALVGNTTPLAKVNQEQKPESLRKPKTAKREIEDPRQMSLF